MVELIIVIAVIGILASLMLRVAGFVQYKGAQSRATSEIAAMSAALESYKADNGDYPVGSVAPGTMPAKSALYLALEPPSKDAGGNPIIPTPKVYFEFNKNMLNTNSGTNIVDPFGETYGYDYPGNPNRSGTNFFDLYSRGNGSTDTNKWLKSW